MPTSPIPMSMVTASALLFAWIGVLATLRRGQWLATLLFSSAFLSIAAFQAGTIGILHAESGVAAYAWATYLAGVSALASWLWLTMSVVLARNDPWQQVKNAGAYLTLALIGCVAMFAASGSPFVVREVHGLGSSAVIVLGGMGKIYLMYLVVVMVAVLMNLERMLRTAPASAKKRLQAMFLAFVAGILTELLVVSAGLLYGGIQVTWLIASAIPLFIAGVVTALALARRRLSDMSVPLARPVVYYSSVSLTLAGAFLLSMAVLSKVLPVLTPEWKRIASVVFYLLVGGGGLMLALSPRVSRGIRRFIDRNFYANRYDYRREWERVTTAIRPTASPEDLGRQIEALMGGLFEAERVAIHLKDPGGEGFRRVLGAAGVAPRVEESNALVQAFHRRPVPVLFRDTAEDIDLIPIPVENRETIQAMRADLCAPLTVGDELVGLLWLSEKRTDENYSYEDVEFLGAMSRQVASALWFGRQAEVLAEARRLESLHRLSSYVLHDIKNQVSGLSLVVENARKHMSNPEFQREAMGVVERAVDSLRELMGQVSGVARPPVLDTEAVALRPLIGEALDACGMTPGERDGLEVRVECPEDADVRVDRRQMLRVLVNLLTNARESLAGGRGSIAVHAAVAATNGHPGGDLVISVSDTGRGMSEEFIRNELFRPFATTKETGLGVGLAQVKGIVEAHGGSIAVQSQPGEGTSFAVTLPGVAHAAREVAS